MVVTRPRSCTMVEFDIIGSVVLGSVTRNEKNWCENLRKVSSFRVAAWLCKIYIDKS